jgi:hypothetical protein
MFRVIILLLSSAVLNICHSQDKIQNKSLTDPSINELYIGIDNQISVDNPKITAIEYAGKTYMKTNGDFKVKAFKTGNATLNFKEGKKIAFSKEYRIKQVGDPILSVSHIDKKTVSLEELVKDFELKIDFPSDCNLKPMFEIVSARVAVSNGKDVYDYPVIGSKLKNKEATLNIPNINIVLIEQVVIRSQDGTTRTIPGRAYHIL